MKKTITMLMIIMSIVGFAEVILLGYKDIHTVFRVICISVVITLELLSGVLKFKDVAINCLQLLFILAFMYFGLQGVEFLLPIVMYKITNHRIKIASASLLSITIFMSLAGENFFYMAVYIVIVNLYLYEVKKQYEENIEVSAQSRGQRYENHLMEQKLMNLERYIEQNNIVTTLKERDYMTQKLHDHLGHRITSSLMQLEVTKETLGKNDELANKYLISAMENLRVGMDETRGILRNMKPREKVMGIEYIREQLLKFQYSSGIKTTLHTEGDIDRLTLNLWFVIQDNLKEALTNIAKYSGATKTEVSIFVYNKIARIEIRDDGYGYKKLDKGLGLRGIEERVIRAGGRIAFENDNGFVINMIFNI
ncbi:sensor histidine kinase [Clostridium cellulovorans]|uniref:histidine kinase n=1 Tax=Clostridium cellulovorans (strain ATCC 35296 / DSM 3052 / OCM 3 / 743B) TaxID=573061 RepID=D9SS44_CLOC7|nr:histidine kinase [Clostridium cellulovorans]ADL52491.1 integral membrane sensor signal transduction histidine kinase [Clostridium cellulovorans 743B]